MGKKEKRGKVGAVERSESEDGRSSPEMESLNCCQLKVHRKKIKDAMKKHHLDPTYNGPLKHRSCTDIICLFLFIIFLGAWIALGVYAFTQGSPGEIFAPRDSNNVKCGFDPGFENKPELVFFDLKQCFVPSAAVLHCNTPQVCVEKCPEENFYFSYYYQQNQLGAGSVDLNFLKQLMICVAGTDLTSLGTIEQLKTLVDASQCADYYLVSTSVAGRCLPDLSAILDPNQNISITVPDGHEGSMQVTVPGVTGLDLDQGSFVVQALSAVNEFWESVAKDLLQTWPWILVCIIGAMLVSLIYIILMRWLAGVMVWFSLIAVVALLSYCSYISFVKYDELKSAANNATEVTGAVTARLVARDAGGISGAFQEQINSYLRMKDTWLAFFIIAVSILAILLIIIIFLRNRIRLAISLINEGSRAVSHSWSTLFFPVFPWLAQICVISYGVVICLYLFSSGVNVYKVTGLPENNTCVCSDNIPFKTDFHNGDVCDADKWNSTCLDVSCSGASCIYMASESQEYTVYLQLYNLFIFFWALFFVGAVGQMILASTFATYYWTYDKSKLPFFMVGAGAWRVFRYHLGTCAFGSLLLAIVSWLRALLEMSDAYLKKYDNQFVKAVKCCMRCFFWCLEKFLRFLNKNAYIMCAIHGKNFCVSAKDAFSLLLRNIIRVFVLDKVTDFLFFISKLVITGGVGAASFYIFSRPVVNLEDLSAKPYQSTYSFVPIVFAIIGTYFITSIFFSVYSMAVDTLFLCFLEDCDTNDGSEEKPYFMTKNLAKILGKKNAKPKDVKDK